MNWFPRTLCVALFQGCVSGGALLGAEYLFPRDAQETKAPAQVAFVAAVVIAGSCDIVRGKGSFLKKLEWAVLSVPVNVVVAIATVIFSGFRVAGQFIVLGAPGFICATLGAFGLHESNDEKESKIEKNE